MKNSKVNLEEAAIATAANGAVYAIDPVTKKCKKVFHEFDKAMEVVTEATQVPLSTYQRYLKDKFSGEDAPIKKGKLHFRDYRIYFDSENGFIVEDTTKKYALVETGFDGIPSPKELAEFFKKPVIEHTPEQLAEATELGKVLAAARSAKFVEEPEVVTTEVDYEKLRKKVLLKVKQVREGVDTAFDPTTFPDMIPFKGWKRKINAKLRAWKTRQIRYKKFLDYVEETTKEQVFVKKEKVHRSSFVGTSLWEFKQVDELKGDKILVDGNWQDAVPFLQNYLLAYEPKAMQQLMRFASGEIDAVTLLKNPYHADHTIEYNSKLLQNTSENAQTLNAFFASCGIVSPQDMVYGGFEVGDEILIFDDGQWKKNVVTKIDEGIELRKGIGLLKLDKYIKLPKIEK